MVFQTGKVKVHVLATMHLGSLMDKQVWFTYTGAPKIQDGRFQFQGTDGTVGNMAWPLAVVNAIGFHQRIYGEVFGHLKQEEAILSKLSQIDARSDRVILQYQPR